MTAVLTGQGGLAASATDTGTVTTKKTTPVLGLTLTNSASGSLQQKASVTYVATGVVSSNGAAEADAPDFVDTFPVGLTPGTATGTDWSCTTTPATRKVTCKWTGGSIAAGTTLPAISIPVTVGTVTGGLTDIGTLSSANATPKSVSATDYGEVVSLPALKVALTDNKTGDFTAGGTVTYAVKASVSTSGGSEADDPVITDTFPADFSAVTSSGTDWTCVQSGTKTTGFTETCTWTGAVHAAGSSYTTLTFKATVSTGLAAKTVIDDSVSVASDDAAGSTATDYALVGSAPAPDLEISASAPRTAPENSAYSLKVTTALGATGGKATDDPSVALTLPVDEKFTAKPAPATWTCSALTTTTRKTTCKYKGTLPVDPGKSMAQIAASVEGTAPGDYTALALISDTTNTATSASSVVTVQVTADPVLALTAAATPTALSAGSSYTLTLSPSIKATGGATHHAPVLKATLPTGKGETFAATPTPADFTCVRSNTTKTLTCTEKTAVIAAGSSLGTVVATVDTTVAGTPLTTTAALSDATDHATTVTATAKVDVTAVPKFALTAAATPTALSAGSSYTVTLTPSTKATGGPTHHAPVLKATLPAGETFAAAPTPADFTCVLSNTTKTLTCTEKTAAIAAGSSLGTVVATVDTTVAGTPLTTTAALSDATDHATTVTATAKVDVTAVPKFALTAAATPTALSAGSSYTVTLTPSTKATGGPTHHAPVLKATLPAGETFAAAPTPADFTCVLSNTTKTLTCTEKTAAIAAGSSLGTVVATVDTTVAGTPLTTTAALSDATDHATTVTATAKVDVTAVPKFALTAAATPTALSAGSSYTVTLTPSTKATGGPTHHAPVLKATLPAGETFAAAPTPADFTCVLSNTTKTLTCTEKTAAIAAGSSLGTVVATVDTTVAGTPLTTTAALSDATDHATTVTATAKVDVTAVPKFALTAAATPTALSAGSSYTVTLTPSTKATGGPTHHAPVLKATLPAGETFAAAPTPADFTCVLSNTTKTLTCTEKTAAIAAGSSLGTVVATVDTTVAGTPLTTTAALSDATDHATTVTATAKVDVTAVPKFALTAAATPTALSAGSSYTVTLTPSTKATGGPTHHAPVLKATLPAGETFAAAPTPADFTCVLSNTTKTLTCTEKTAAIAAGSSLGTVVATVDTTVAGTPLTTTAALSDATDHATTVTATAKVDVTAVPVLGLTAAATPTQAEVGTSYTLILTPSVTGSAYHHSKLTDTLPTGETFAAPLPTITGWTCALSSGTKTLTCTSTTDSGLKPVKVVVDVAATAATGVHTDSATLSDATDGASPVTKTSTVTVTSVPVLGLSTSGTPAQAEVGTSYTLTLTPSVTGTAYHHSKLIVTLPSGETFAPLSTITGWSCGLSDGTAILTCTSTTDSGLKPVTVTVDVSPSALTGAHTTTATLSDATDSATPVTKTAAVTVTNVPVLGLTTSGTPAQAEVGTSYTLTLTPSVTGTAYHHSKLIVTLPTGETFAPLPTITGWSCGLSGGTATLTCTSATDSGLKTVTVTVEISPSALAGVDTTTATLSDATDGATPVSKTASVTVTSVPVLGLTSSGTPAQAEVGTSYTLTLTPTVTGTAYHHSKLTATLPTGETFAPLPTITGWSCGLSGGTETITCTSTTDSGLKPVTVTVDVSPSAETGAHTTTATLSDATDSATPVTKTASVTVTNVPVLGLSTSGTPAQAEVGTSYTLTLTPTVTGTAYHRSKLIVTLPTGETFAPLSTITGWSCALSDGTATLTCTSATDSGLKTVTVTVDVGATAATGINTTTATLSDATDSATPVTKTASVTVTAVPELGLSTSGTPALAEVGTSYTLTLTPSVTGTAYHHSTLIVTLPTGETFAPLPTITGWSCGLSGGTATLTCTSTTDSGLKTVTVTVEISPSALAGVDTTTATLSDATDGATPVSKTASVTVTSVPVLGLSSSGTPAQAEVGTSYTLTLTPTVTGTAYHHSKLTATLPTGETFAPLPTITGWSCGLSGGTATITCTSTTDSGLKPVTVTVDVSPSAETGAHTTTATLSDATDSATPVTKTASVTVTNVPVLGLSTSGTPAQAEVGTSYTLTLTPSVNGTAYHHSELTVTLPTGETFAPLPTITGWSCGLSGGTAILTCTSTTDSGLKAVTVTGDVAATAETGVHTTTATLSDATDGATPVTKTASVTVTAVPVLGLTTSGTPAQAEVGTSYTLTLTPTVTGTAYHHSTLTVTLPTGETFAPLVTITGWSCGLSDGTKTLTCTSTTDSGLKPVKVTVNVAATAETGAHTTTATLSDATDSATAVTKTATATVTNVPTLGLGISGTPAQAEVGTSYTLTLTPSVTGTAYHHSTLTATLPAGETFAALATITGWTCGLSDGTKILTCTSTSDSDLKTVKVAVDISPSADAGAHTTTATLSDATDGATPVTKTAAVTVTAVPVLGLTASGTPTQAEVGTSYTLTLTPTVTGTAYHHSTLTVTLPTGETFAPLVTITGWSCGLSDGTKTLTCTSTTDSGLKPVKVTVNVAATAETGAHTTTATLSDATDSATAVTKTATATVTNVPVLGLMASGTPALAEVGTSYTLTLTPSVTGTAYHHSKLTVTLPPGETFAPLSTITGWSCALSDGTRILTCTSTTDSGLKPVKVTVDISSSAGAGAHTTTATLSDATDGAAPLTKTTTVTVTAVPVLSLTTSGTPSGALAGSSYTLTLSPGTTVAGGPADHVPTLTATLPAGETFTSTPSPAGWTCGLFNGTRTLTCVSTHSTPIAAGSSLGSVTAGVSIASGASGSLTMNATLADATDKASPATASATVTVNSPPSPPPGPAPQFGYRLAGSDGGVFAYGDASFLGSMISRHQVPSAPIVGIANNSTGNGYWLVGSDGSIYTFGNAQNFGSIQSAGITLDKPIVGIADTPDGGGYWLVASDGGVFAFGDAGFYGNTYTLGIENQLDKPVAGIADTPTGHGYWLVAQDGGVFAFGNAGFFGNTYTLGIEDQLDKPVVGIAATPSGKGYWLAAADGGVFSFGSAPFEGNTYTVHIEDQLQGPVVGISAMPTGGGYWLGATDGGVFAFGSAPFLGNTYTTGIEDQLNGPINGFGFAP